MIKTQQPLLISNGKIIVLNLCKNEKVLWIYRNIDWRPLWHSKPRASTCARTIRAVSTLIPLIWLLFSFHFLLNLYWGREKVDEETWFGAIWKGLLREEIPVGDHRWYGLSYMNFLYFLEILFIFLKFTLLKYIWYTMLLISLKNFYCGKSHII